MKTYLDTLRNILDDGVQRGDRTGTGTIGVFGTQMRFDLSKGFPMMTTKKVALRLVLVELLWFLQGRTDKRWLNDRNCHIWDEWGGINVGPAYGWQWRNFGAEYDPEYVAGWQPSCNGVDQISNVIESLKKDPEGRRHIVTAWNPEDLSDMALPPCHMMFQFFVADGKLSCQLYQRSADMFLGVPFNIASYALLTHIIAKEVGLDVGEFIWVGGDTHIYLNHIEQVTEQLSREPYQLPTLTIADDVPRSEGDILPNYSESDFVLTNYTHHPTIKAPVAV